MSRALLTRVNRFLRQPAASTSNYWLTRFVFLRLLGFVYFFAFLSLALQVVPLIGEEGLLPAENFLEAYGSRFGSIGNAFISLPTVFWVHLSDTLLVWLAWAGVVVSLVVLAGYANVFLLAAVWFLYMSFVHVGQLWLSYGWEIQLLETGFLALFLVPLWDARPFPKRPPPMAVIWLLRWLAFRVHLGSGLIKMRGSSCWHDLTCLFYHYETQPIPNLLSPWFHALPRFVHKLGVLFSHFVQLVVPFFVFPRLVRQYAGVIMIAFQFILILSGNLSFLNWVTILPVLAYLDDTFLAKLLPQRIVARAHHAQKHARAWKYQRIVSVLLVLITIGLSISVIQNLLSSNQAMNTSFNQLHLLNTYGAFGSIGSVRHELIIEGTTDTSLASQTEWKAYEFIAKPGDPNRRLPIIAPYQPRIDWQIWFAALSAPQRQPWLIHFVWKLLHNDQNTMSLISYNPFPDTPPTFIRIEFYRYELKKPWEEVTWRRTYIGTWLPPLSKETPELQQFIQANKWG